MITNSKRQRIDSEEIPASIYDRKKSNLWHCFEEDNIVPKTNNEMFFKNIAPELLDDCHSFDEGMFNIDKQAE